MQFHLCNFAMIENLIFAIMVGTLIGAGIGLLGSIGSTAYGAWRSKKYADEARNQTASMRKDNKRWYDVRMAQNFTERPDAQAAFSRQREMYDEQAKRNRAVNAVAGGGSNAQQALQQQAAAGAMADTTRSIAAAGAARKDNIEKQYLATDAALQQQQIQGNYNQAAQVAQAAGQAATAFGQLGQIGANIDKNILDTKKAKNGII